MNINHKGDAEKESKLHKKFSKYRIHGEWFTVEKSILKYIGKLCDMKVGKKSLDI